MKREIRITFLCGELSSLERFKLMKRQDTAALIGDIVNTNLVVDCALITDSLKDDDEMYSSLLLISNEGEAYKTSSQTFIDSFEEIADCYLDMDEAWREVNPLVIKVCERPSKKYPGKTFYLAEMV